jgi:hypothetical protein
MALGDGAFYQYENVSAVVVNSGDGDAQMYQVVGGRFAATANNAAQMYLGDVNTLQPYPHLWAIRPTSGRPGDGFKIYGYGLGPTQATYSSSVEMQIADVWEAIPVVTWVEVAQSAEYATSASAIEPTPPNIDPHHQEIELVIPPEGVPPGHQVRVVTIKP